MSQSHEQSVSYARKVLSSIFPNAIIEDVDVHGDTVFFVATFSRKRITNIPDKITVSSVDFITSSVSMYTPTSCIDTLKP